MQWLDEFAGLTVLFFVTIPNVLFLKEIYFVFPVQASTGKGDGGWKINVSLEVIFGDSTKVCLFNVKGLYPTFTVILKHT